MPTNTTRVTREELYEQVWSEPMQKLAKKYGLSDVGLAKTCRRLAQGTCGTGAARPPRVFPAFARAMRSGALHAQASERRPSEGHTC